MCGPAGSPAADGPFANVAVPVPLRRSFTYRVEERLASRIEVGARVRVPFGPRRVVGTVVEYPAPPPVGDFEVRPIEALVPDAARLPPVVLGLTAFVADYYLCSRGEAIEAALPPDVVAGRVVEEVRRLPEAPDPTDRKRVPKGATLRRHLLERLPSDGAPIPVASLDGQARRAIPRLRKLGWVEVLRRTILPPDRPPTGKAAVPQSAPAPTGAQQAVLDLVAGALERRAFAPHVLFGATGSGKTEVYLRAARMTLEAGRSVLYLVPEIGLTPLLRSLVERRFPGRCAVLHSGLSPRERREAWERVRAGSRPVVIGTRSAVFAPLRDVGLIVVDEEQDGSYKQDETPRYNARDVAVVRGRAEQAVVLLGSATPSAESFGHARSGRYGLLRLGPRIHDRPMARVSLIDMRREFERTGRVTPLSRALLDELCGCLERGEQALVLRNRRGWSAALLCPRCGNRLTCPHCSLSFTWHRADRRLRCHYCDAEARIPEACPTCGAPELKALGEGTEQIEALLGTALPGARIERMDRDTLRRRGTHEQVLRRFDRREIDVLVGTQMIAKGHDFPAVTLVGVLSADQSLGIPDFRAGERTFQLLAQVAGRAGRGDRPGRVIVQGFDVHHPVLQLAAAQDYESFFRREIEYRRALRYPPVAAMVRILVQDREQPRARDWARAIAAALREHGDPRILLSGPGPAPVERLKGRYRQQILARSAGRRRLVEAVDRALTALGDSVPRRSYFVDVDPQTMT